MTMLLLLALQAVAPPPAVEAGPLAAIGRQALPTRGCAAYLWAADRRLVGMAVAEPAQIRLAIDGAALDYARTSQTGAGGFGFGGVTEYRRGDVTATLDMTIAPRSDMTGGAPISQATLRIDRTGHDTIVVPVGGLIGCAAG